MQRGAAGTHPLTVYPAPPGASGNTARARYRVKLLRNAHQIQKGCTRFDLGLVQDIPGWDRAQYLAVRVCDLNVPARDRISAFNRLDYEVADTHLCFVLRRSEIIEVAAFVVLRRQSFVTDVEEITRHPQDYALSGRPPML